MKNRHTYPPIKDGTECSETSAYTIQTPGNYPEESIQHSESGESLKSRNQNCIHEEFTSRLTSGMSTTLGSELLVLQLAIKNV